MKNIVVLMLLCSVSGMASELPAVTHYTLEANVKLKERRLNVVATLSIKNSSNKSHAQLPFLLYRLLTVERVSAQNGIALPFDQHVVALHDQPSLQARGVTIDLPSPLRPGDSVTVTLTYGGFIFGYPEVMAYVKDRIDEEYSLLRPDSYAYPLLAEPTFASARAASDSKFTYDLSITVPKGYRAACGGELIGTPTGTDSLTFLFRSKIPTWRIDIAVAKFSTLSDPENKLVVYHLPEDSLGARQVLAASRDVVNLYSNMFGEPKSYNGYTIIEIPDGWGSQASDYYFLQTAAAFKDSSRVSEVYHEVGHSWNATPSADVRRCRYFDEAFASYYESLAIRVYRGEKAFEADMEQSRALFARWAAYDPQVLETPISGYGVKELGRHSYTKGAWSLYVLNHLVGDRSFNAIIQSMLSEFNGRTIGFREFQKLCERVTKLNLDKFFQEWIFGSISSRLMVDKVSIADIAKRYQK